tara:strand:+ start:1415 stop:3214 length:1800 start_codon:yes stop_codon:yes gene_type:complete
LIILGISDSIESHACIVKDGVLLAAHAEERFSRLKADSGYPYNAIKQIFKLTGISPTEVDVVALAGYDNGKFQSLYKPNALFNVSDWILQNELYWKPKLYENKPLSELDDFLIWEKKFPQMKKDPYYPFIKKAKKNNPKDYLKLFNEQRKKTISDQLGISKNKIYTFRHETCHQYYGYYSQQSFKKDALIFTLEGGGDDSSATISVVKNYQIKEKYKTNDAMVGRIYRYITLLLGMKPGQHEYKVMGLAPYGTKYHGQKSLEHFRKFNKIKGYKIEKTKNFKDVYLSSKKMLQAERFDGIAWGLQQYVEEFIEKWTLNAIKKFKISDIIFSGGVAQNIKAMKHLISLREVKSVWTGPVSGDGSLAIGAAWIANKKLNKKHKIRKMDNIYLGTEIKSSSLKKEILKRCKKFKIVKNIKNKKIAEWLSKGLIIARCRGRMEFGQRSLGNRSILADSRNYNNIDKINKKIKIRDFWMPFTPSLTIDGCKKILKNPKNIYSPYMTMAFDINKNYEKYLSAVIHPSDKSIRPQMLKRESNKDYYDLLKEYEKITGLPVLLNTSFNLHGDAIVENATQAINTFKRSDLDILVINNFAIIRREKND